MPGAWGVWRKPSVAAAVLPVLLLLTAPRAGAIEAVDGRVQLHGFGEIQMRALSRNFNDDVDLAQWYNVLNLELEVDVAPDGFGPMDLVEAYVRVEARYDCVWTRGCGMLRSADAYGDRSNKLPKRLRDAKEDDFSGVIPPTPPGIFSFRRQTRTTEPVLRIGDKRSAPLLPNYVVRTDIESGVAVRKLSSLGLPPLREPVPGEGLAGFDTLFGQRGADNVAGTTDDPGIYTFEKILFGKNAPYTFALLDFKGPPGGSGTAIVGPWRPKNFIQANGLMMDRANPFRGAFAAMTNAYRGDDPLDPVLEDLKALLFASPRADALDAVTSLTLVRPDDVTGDSFAGDFSGVVPCIDPSSTAAVQQRTGANLNGTPKTNPFTDNCYPNLEVLATPAPAPGGDPTQPFANVLVSFQNEFEYVDIPTGVTQDFVEPKAGGFGELPMRPAPDLSNLAPTSANPQGLLAQGLYIPSRGLQSELLRGDLDGLGFNFNQLERSWNRGQSQQQTGELKEAYLDIEWMDSRLWTRIGKQSIVWGKTELFRTTDQFNPQDLALASLPSLEESRIALWAFRAVYSLYDVGPLQDVRLEVATNFDEFQPADLGASGEPFTPDIVGSITNGIFFHSFTGVGIAGIDRPDNPWDNIKGLEVGFRAEFRWGPFSFAVTDFYGYNDFPFVDRIWSYTKSNDVITNRPLVGGLPPFGNASLCTGPILDRDMDGTIDTRPDPANPSVPTRSIIDSKSPHASSYLGIGADPACLKGGGAAGFANASPDFGGDQNALQFHHANQQIFAWICNLTIGIGAALDPGTCAWNIFDSPTNLGGNILQVPFVEFISAMSAGDRDSRVRGVINQIISNTKGNLNNRIFTVPLSPLNGDPGPANPDCPTLVGDYDPFAECARWDGVIGITTRDFNFTNPEVVDHTFSYRGMTINTSCDIGISGAPGFRRTSNTGPVLVTFLEDNVPEYQNHPDKVIAPGLCAPLLFHHDPQDTLSLDSTLSNFQKALLGCGPFYGTRCDSGRLIEVLPFGSVIDGATDAEAVQALIDAIVLQHPEGGGIDFMNTEASALLQSWPGTEGTAPRTNELGNDIYWTTLGRRRQPGTARVVDSLAFEDGGHESDREFGPACTRPDGQGGLVTLPGCRGIETITLVRGGDTVVDSILISFEDGYDPSIDGCLIGGGGNRVSGAAVGNIGGVDVFVDANANGNAPAPADLEVCHTDSFHRRAPATPFGAAVQEFAGSSWLWHPLAGCLSERRAEAAITESDSLNRDPDTGVAFAGCGVIDTGGGTAFDRIIRQRFEDRNGNGFIDIEEEFLNTIDRLDDVDVTMAQIFRSEMAALSFNFMQFLVITSCSISNENNPNPAQIVMGIRGNITHKQECFDPELPLQADKCSFNAPHLCSNVKGFLAVAGVTRNDVRAGGNARFGRRTFIWHSGGEVVLRYQKRNVLGFSADFAEDVTKSNWGVEFTWIEGLPFTDANEYDNISKSDALNLTVSVDRPTFVNFLNANRTLFINSQWFFQYVPGYEDSFTSNGPWNILFTFAVFTGYFQDRLQPSFISVFDVQSQSGGFLPNVSYRFTESFSATIGANIFFGRTQRTKMPINEIAPVSNRAPLGNNEAIAYKDGVDNILSLVRKRDEFFLRLRWTF